MHNAQWNMLPGLIPSGENYIRIPICYNTLSATRYSFACSGNFQFQLAFYQTCIINILAHRAFGIVGNEGVQAFYPVGVMDYYPKSGLAQELNLF